MCAEAARRSQAGALVALITNGSFLDGPVHRGMRAALRRWFDQLYVLDLGGSALLQRTAADRPERDDNVFGVRPSVSISWLCRLPGPSADSDRAGALSYARLWGTRSKKLEVLGAARFADLGFEPITPEPGHAFFVPRRTVEREYASWPSLADWMPFHREGVQTNRDHLAIDVDRSQLLQRLRAFASGAVEVAAPPRAHFNLAQARRNVAAALERDPDGLLGISVERIAYRPFDGRFFSPVAPLCHRPRPELLRAIAHAPQVLVSLRKDRGFSPYSHFGAADGVIDNCFLSTRSSCRARAFPACTPDGRGNLSLALADRASERAGEAVSPAQFQRYALAHLASPRYRRRFDAELHADYPRIPLPEGPERWRSLVAAGDALFQLLLAPLERPIVCDDAGQPEVRCGELRVLAADGCIVARGEQVLTASPAALGLWLGHLQPIKAYLASRAEAPFTPQLRATLQALVQRLESICRSIGHVDVWLELA